jgi:hypothetical protein
MNPKTPAIMAFALLCALPGAAVAQHADQAFGSFHLPAAAPNMIQLIGDITPAAALDFKRALRARPQAAVLDLASNGGDVLAALTVAFDVFERKMDTRIRAGAGCYSACAYLFFAGDRRQADGELGVHQVSSPGQVDLTSAQYTIAEIIQAMALFGVDPTVVTTMFRTPPEAMYVFTRQELAELAIEREGSPPPANVAVATAPTSPQPAAAANVMVVAKTRTNPLPDYLDVVMPIADSADISETLDRIGFDERGVRLATPVLGAVLNSKVIPAASEIRILFGPYTQDSKTFVPYRVSIYDGDEHRHLGTIALTDVGDYKEGAEPLIGSSDPNQQYYLGKVPRRR